MEAVVVDSKRPRSRGKAKLGRPGPAVGPLMLPVSSNEMRSESSEDGSLTLLDSLAQEKFTDYLSRIADLLENNELNEVPTVVEVTFEGGTSLSARGAEALEVKAVLREAAGCGKKIDKFVMTLACGCGVKVEKKP
jgi:hypothetical protein